MVVTHVIFQPGVPGLLPFQIPFQMQIYVSQSGEQTGPFTEEELQPLLDAGMFNLTDHAWCEGLAEWLPLHQVLGVDAPAPVPQPTPIPVANRPVTVAARPSAVRPAAAPRPSAFVSVPAGGVTMSMPKVSPAPRPMGAVPTGNYQPMKVTDWLLTFLLAAIPIVGIVMMFVWAFSKDTQPSKQSFSKAYLILLGGMMVLMGILLALGVGSAMAAAAAGSNPKQNPRTNYPRR